MDKRLVLEYPKYKPRKNGTYTVISQNKPYECEWIDNHFEWKGGVIEAFLSNDKPIHVKPSLYAYYFEKLKEIAIKYGYNLVLHGSMNRDLDMIAIPWEYEILPYIDSRLFRWLDTGRI